MTSTYKELDIYSIELDRENPRIKMFLEIYGDNVTAEGIALALSSSGTDTSTSFQSLREAIRVHKGIINPIIVNQIAENRYRVIEGNTRLQIYREFDSKDSSGLWKKIRAIVYENLSEEEIHSIRLQSHLVGPRDWDPYSKAKYLFHLCYDEHLPMTQIISYCGGKRSEILKLIDAYDTMQKYYIPLAKEMGAEVDIREFSKFAEFKNKPITDAMLIAGYEPKDFALWVINGNVDKAQNVRQLPQVLKEPEAKKEFLKTNLTNAIKKLSITVNTTIDLSSLSYDELGSAFLTKLRNISYSESRSLKKKETKEYEDKMTLLIDIFSELEMMLEDLNTD